jgi:hypothetical protein
VKCGFISLPINRGCIEPGVSRFLSDYHVVEPSVSIHCLQPYGERLKWIIQAGHPKPQGLVPDPGPLWTRSQAIKPRRRNSTLPMDKAVSVSPRGYGSEQELVLPNTLRRQTPKPLHQQPQASGLIPHLRMRSLEWAVRSWSARTTPLQSSYHLTRAVGFSARISRRCASLSLQQVPWRGAPRSPASWSPVSLSLARLREHRLKMPHPRQQNDRFLKAAQLMTLSLLAQMSATHRSD